MDEEESISLYDLCQGDEELIEEVLFWAQVVGETVEEFVELSTRIFVWHLEQLPAANCPCARCADAREGNSYYVLTHDN